MTEESLAVGREIENIHWNNRYTIAWIEDDLVGICDQTGLVVTRRKQLVLENFKALT
jgi:hypothetical protein